MQEAVTKKIETSTKGTSKEIKRTRKLASLLHLVKILKKLLWKQLEATAKIDVAQEATLRPVEKTTQKVSKAMKKN